MDKVTLADLDTAGKTVLLRADFNVSVSPESGEVTSDQDHRLRATLPTIRYLTDRGCRVILCSHLGRPGGQVVEGLRMAPVARRLSALLGATVRTVNDCIGPEAATAVSKMAPGEALLLENLRFHPGEEANDPGFAAALCAPADVFVQDAFGAAHRAHASIIGPTRLLPSAAGLLLQREVETLGAALRSPRRPMAAVLGGAKVSDKIKLMNNLAAVADALFVGGGMAGTFLKAQGLPVGGSLVEDGLLDFARVLIKQGSVPVHLPTDVVVASEFGANPTAVRTVATDAVPSGYVILDVGPATARDFASRLSAFGTIIWNGPMGVFEYPRFSSGTAALAEGLALAGGTTIIGGGSTAEAVESLGLSQRMSHVSTGGGAMIEFLEGRDLPGIAALPSKGPAGR